MEIPIQVAVRVYPASRPTAVEQNTDANGNKNTQNTKRTNAGARHQLHADALNSNEDEDEIEKDHRFCVETIPVAPYVVPLIENITATSLVPGHLDGTLQGLAGGLVQVGQHSFPVTHALPIDCTQSQIYHQAVFPLISLFLQGFDASVVSYGQRGCGKTYTLYGHGFDCFYGEADQGIVHRCVREIFGHMAGHGERTYAINIGWVEICGEEIHDLLGMGNVHCTTITDVFHWLQVGLSARNRRAAEFSLASAHSLFTLTLEQQWVTEEGLIQHRLSTASFSDLCATDRLNNMNINDQSDSMPKDVSLQALDHVVDALTDPAVMCGANGPNCNIPYNRTTLTTLLKDSFGGRAQTLLILCVSPLLVDINETVSNLQFAFKVQNVSNFVVMNTFSDDNMPISPEGPVPEIPMGNIPPGRGDNFGLQFAASQWFKLVSNAEGLFSKLIASNAISQAEKEQIEEWLFLKQECEECMSSGEAIRAQKQLGPIQEAEEPDEMGSDPETSCHALNSDNDTDSESQRPDFTEKLESLMDSLRLKTDSLVKDRHKEFLEKQPKAVMESQESLQQKQDMDRALTERPTERKASVGGRRRSIQPGASLSSAEIAMLNQVASREQAAAPKLPDDFLDSSGDILHPSLLRAAINSPVEAAREKLRKLTADIEAKESQIKEIELNMLLKESIIEGMVKNRQTRGNAKQQFNKKKAKLEAEHEKAKKQLAKAMVQGRERLEVERLRAGIAHLEQRLQDLTSIKHIAGESGQQLKKMQKSLHESRKLVEEMQKKLKKDKKLRDQLEAELKALKEKENSKGLVKTEGVDGACGGEEERGKNLKDVQARISHLDHVLREKSENLEQYDGEGSSGQREGLRHEIRNLRRTRDHLLDQRCQLDRKLKRDKMLSHREERKLLECDEAIEAIDAAIEFKNEMICGHKSIDTSASSRREKGEQMLMARLNKLSDEEMRTLLYKYFNKVIDLRDSSRKLEMQLLQLERERDAWEWKERVVSNAVRQARLEGERNVVLLQRQHEIKLALMLRHLAEETSVSSASFNDHHHQQQRYMPSAGLALAPHYALSSPNGTTTTASSQYSDSDFDFEMYQNMTQTNKMLKPPKHGEMEMCPLPDALAKYKPLDKFKEKERESKNKLFAKFQVLTRYAGASSASAAVGNDGHAMDGQGGKKKDKEMVGPAAAAIPQENLKRLMSAPSATKVTRQKNKIIIQDASRKN